VFGEVSTGASNDLEKVSKIARNMIVVYGMSRQAPNMSLIDSTQQSFLGQGQGVVNHSEKLEELIDGEVQEIVESCYKEAKQVLADHRDKLTDMATQLLKREKIDESDIVAILGPRPQPKTRSNSEVKEAKN
jgi:cell division protease FtsH